MKRVDLSLHNNYNCGGDDVYIELIQGEISCEISHKIDFDLGTILSWNGSALGTCLGKDFNVEQYGLNFKIRSTSGEDLCPKSLTISMDNGYSYKKTGMNDWVDKDKGDQNRIAPRISVKSVGKSILHLCVSTLLKNSKITFHNITNVFFLQRLQ